MYSSFWKMYFFGGFGFWSIQVNSCFAISSHRHGPRIMWTNLHFGIVFSGHWYIAGHEWKKKCQFDIDTFVILNSRLSLFSFFFSLPCSCSFALLVRTCGEQSLKLLFVSLQMSIRRKLWWRKRSIYRRRARKKGSSQRCKWNWRLKKKNG